MKNKCYIALASIGLMMGYGCSESTIENEAKTDRLTRTPMTFEVGVEKTRSYVSSVQTSIPDGSHFVLSAKYKSATGDTISVFGPEFVFVEVTDNGLDFIPEEGQEMNYEFFWPEDPNAEVEIYAYYSGEEDNLVFPYLDSGNNPDLWNYYPADPDSNFDVLAVGLKLKTSEAKGSPVPLLFRHIVSMVSFEAKAAEDGCIYQLNKISMKGRDQGQFDRRSLWDDTIETPWQFLNSEEQEYAIFDSNDGYAPGPEYAQVEVRDPRSEAAVYMPVQAFLIPDTYSMTIEYAYAVAPEEEGATPQWQRIVRDNIEITLNPGKSTVIRLGLVSDQLNIGGENGTGDSAD